MVINVTVQEIMMDHALRTISYIADIGDVLVIMARRGPVMNQANDNDGTRRKSQTKILCHVFETEEVIPTVYICNFSHLTTLLLIGKHYFPSCAGHMGAVVLCSTASWQRLMNLLFLVICNVQYH